MRPERAGALGEFIETTGCGPITFCEVATAKLGCTSIPAHSLLLFLRLITMPRGYFLTGPAAKLRESVGRYPLRI